MIAIGGQTIRRRLLGAVAVVALAAVCCNCSNTAQEERIRASFAEINQRLQSENANLEIEGIGTCEDILRMSPHDASCQQLICKAKYDLRDYGVDFDAELRLDGIRVKCPSTAK